MSVYPRGAIGESRGTKIHDYQPLVFWQPRKASEVFNSWLEGPYGTWVKVIYVRLLAALGSTCWTGHGHHIVAVVDSHGRDHKVSSLALVCWACGA